MLTVSRQILISAPKESVRLYLRDLNNMSEYEKKVDRVNDVAYPDDESGMVDVQGKWFGLPWRGSFKMEFTRDGGFRSEMVRGPLPKMNGGFHLRPVSGGTMLTHDEHYHFPLFMKPLAFFAKGWLARSIELELGVIKEGAERLHRQLQIRQIESSL
jgi:hypothetical protein